MKKEVITTIGRGLLLAAMLGLVMIPVYGAALIHIQTQWARGLAILVATPVVFTLLWQAWGHPAQRRRQFRDVSNPFNALRQGMLTYDVYNIACALEIPSVGWLLVSDDARTLFIDLKRLPPASAGQLFPCARLRVFRHKNKAVIYGIECLEPLLAADAISVTPDPEKMKRTLACYRKEGIALVDPSRVSPE